jgi:hypothetical protein
LRIIGAPGLLIFAAGVMSAPARRADCQQIGVQAVVDCAPAKEGPKQTEVIRIDSHPPKLDHSAKPSD